MVRKRVEYLGRVQGVGFRARCVRIAAGLSVTGWVRNEEDGSVSAEIQGADEAVEEFLDLVREELGHLIRHEACGAMTPSEDEVGFRVRG